MKKFLVITLFCLQTAIMGSSVAPQSSNSTLDPFMILTQDQVALLAVTLAQITYTKTQLPLPTQAQLNGINQVDLQNSVGFFNGNNPNNPSSLVTTLQNSYYGFTPSFANKNNPQFHKYILAIALLGLLQNRLYSTSKTGTITLFPVNQTPLSPAQFAAINNYVQNKTIPASFDPLVQAAIALYTYQQSMSSMPSSLTANPIPLPVLFPAYAVIASWLGQALPTPLNTQQAQMQFMGMVTPLPAQGLPTLSAADFSALATFIKTGTFTPQITTTKTLMAAINSYYFYTKNNANNHITAYPQASTLMTSYYPTGTLWPNFYPFFSVGQAGGFAIAAAQANYAQMQLPLPTQGQLTPDLMNPGQTTIIYPTDLKYIQNSLVSATPNLSSYSPINGQSFPLGKAAFNLYTNYNNCSIAAIQNGQTCPITFTPNQNDYNMLALSVLTLMQNNLYWNDMSSNTQDVFFLDPLVNQTPLTSAQFATVTNYLQSNVLPPSYDPAVQATINAYFYQQQLGQLAQLSKTIANPLNQMALLNTGSYPNPNRPHVNIFPAQFPAYPLIAVWLAQAQYAGKQLPIDNSFSEYWVYTLQPTTNQFTQSPFAQALFYLVCGAQATINGSSVTINGQPFSFETENEYQIVALVNQIVQCSTGTCSVDFTQSNAQAALAYIGQMKYMGMLMPLPSNDGLPTLSPSDFANLVSYVRTGKASLPNAELYNPTKNPALFSALNLYYWYTQNNANNQITFWPSGNIGYSLMDSSLYPSTPNNAVSIGVIQNP